MIRSPKPIRDTSRVEANALTVDVEEYFHPTEVQENIESGRWSSLPSRVERETYQILELFKARGVTATFFVLGWVAERYPDLVRAIAGQGHQIGCHSYAHQLIYKLTPDQFRRDTNRAIAAIGDACGVMPRIYRAPSYSITNASLWALEVLVECGFTHDSSIYPISHDRYGITGSLRHAHTLQTPSGPIEEIPIATVRLSKDRIAPVGGGGYLRLLPYRYTAAGIRKINAEGQPACIYFHPWEIDADQPRLATGLISRIRTYTGVKGMLRKVERLLTDFRFSSIAAVYGEKDSRLKALPAGES
jgi:polysaccharide deacetylase family protein (PEP-CTERM system associated)